MTLFAKNSQPPENGSSQPHTPTLMNLRDTHANATGEMAGSETKTLTMEDASTATPYTQTALNVNTTFGVSLVQLVNLTT